MAKVYLDDTTLTGMANQTRRLTNTEDTYTPSEMITALSQVESGSKLNIFVQTTEPETYDGIWIKSNDFEYQNINEIESKEDVMASSINIQQGETYSTKITENYNISYKRIFITNSQNEIIRNAQIYSGNGQQWEEIQYPTITELEWVQTNGSQRVDTGIIGSNTINVDLDFEIPAVTQWSCIIGAKNGDVGYTCGVTNNNSVTGGWITRYMTEQNFSNNNIMALNLRTKLQSREKSVTYTNTNGTFTFSVTPAVDVYTTGTNDLTLFANKTNTSSYKDYSKIKLYRCKIWQDGKLVRDLIPAKDTNDVVCLWDDISETYFHNTGYGTMTGGPVVS